MFWSVILDPGKRYSRTLDKVYHINSAVLSDDDDPDEDERVSLWFQCSTGPPILLCNLNRKGNTYCQLSLYFNIGESVSFWTNSGKSYVYLTGLTNGTVGDLRKEFSCNSHKWWIGKFPSRDMSSQIFQSNRKKRRKDRKWTFPLKRQKVLLRSNLVDSDNVESVNETHLRPKESPTVHKKIDETVFLPMAPGHWLISERLIKGKDNSKEFLANNVKTLSCMLTGELQVPETLFSKGTTPTVTDKSERSLEMLTCLLSGQLKIMNGLMNESVENSRETSHLLTCLLKGQLHITPRSLSTQTHDKLPSQNTSQKKILEGGVEIDDLVVGDGVEAETGCQVTVFYSGRLKQDNKQFDSVKTGLGLRFRVGHKEVIKGWEIGIVGMRAGGRRIISMPPQVAYGAKGHPPLIPPNSILVFDVQLKNVKKDLDDS